MLLKTSCCKAALRKDITRFAPAWGLYILCLFLGLMLMVGGEIGYTLPSAMASLIPIMPVINAGWGLVTAQLLFGDLHSSRLCYGLHALPLKREEWFGVHTLSGILFSLVPTALMALAATPITAVTARGIPHVWQIPVLWWLATNLQYLCFFGLGCLSMLLSGSRLGGVLIYGVLNLAAVGVAFLLATLYIPLLYGIEVDYDSIYLFAPIVGMTSPRYIATDFSSWYDAYHGPRLSGSFELTKGWCYLWICAGVGILLILLAREAYRRRNLEAAGNTVAFPWLKPLFRAAAALACCTGSQFFIIGFLGIRDFEELNLSFFLQLAVTLGAGWFLGDMILQRSARVFRPKSFLGLGALVLVLFLSVGITWLDPLGIESYIPEAEEVRSVEIRHYGGGHSRVAHLEGREDIETILHVQEYALEGKYPSSALRYQGKDYRSHAQLPDALSSRDMEYTMEVYLCYTLENGREVSRTYSLFPTDPGGQLLRGYFSSFSYVTGFDNPQEALSKVHEVFLEGEALQLQGSQLWQLVQAIYADCQEGAMVQLDGYHEGMVYEEPNGYHRKSYWLNFLFWDEELSGIGKRDFNLEVFADSTHTLAWLEEMGLTDVIK